MYVTRPIGLCMKREEEAGVSSQERARWAGGIRRWESNQEGGPLL
jgi:hypothetical protein